MKHDVKAPEVGESITEVSILKWAKQNGDAVDVGDVLLEIESDKATVEVIAEQKGALAILKQEGETIPVGEIVAQIDDAATGNVSASAPAASAPAPSAGLTPQAPAAAPAPGAGLSPVGSAPAALTPAQPAASPAAAPAGSGLQAGPAAQKLASDAGISISQVSGTGKGARVMKEDVLRQIKSGGTTAAPTSVVSGAAQPNSPSSTTGSGATAAKDRPGDRRKPMSRLRKTIAQRLLDAQHNAAMLTTFNEVDMKPVMDLRKQYKEKFKEKHGTPLSFMSFFTRACVLALKEIEAVNASIDGTDMIYHDYADIGIAVGTDRGLVVPVLRGAQELSFLGIEKGIAALAGKARDGKLSIAEMTGGTFTISNGGVYGSMLSTPILNPPQSAILGMHGIKERPVVIDGQVVVRPIMNLALSYDHRIIDGKEAVTFLIKIKEGIENPENLNLDFVNEL